MLVRDLVAQLLEVPQDVEVYSGVPGNVCACGPLFGVVVEDGEVIISEIELRPRPTANSDAV